LPSIPVRGFGQDGLLVTGGVGSSTPAEFQTISCRGAQTGILGSEHGIAGLGVMEGGVSAGFVFSAPMETTIVATGSQRGLLGRQSGSVRIDSAYLTALCDLDEDLAWAA
jgi:hypothetical protein